MDVVRRRFHRFKSRFFLDVKESISFHSRVIHSWVEGVSTPYDGFYEWKKNGLNLMTPLIVSTFRPFPSFPLSLRSKMFLKLSEVVFRVGIRSNLGNERLRWLTGYPWRLWGVWIGDWRRSGVWIGDWFWGPVKRFMWVPSVHVCRVYFLV